MKIKLEAQVRQACRHLLSEFNRDPSTSAYGCFDRRYWAWKLADFPEATFQRNLANLAWYMDNCEGEADPAMIREAVIAGLAYTAKIQHSDGSFDQAYPFERSFGATGFLLPDLIKTYRTVRNACSQKQKKHIECCLLRAASFLSKSAEKHGLISNHLAGVALGLFEAEDIFNEKSFGDRGRVVLDIVLSNQSSEGWFPEYGGADPGYQTLCMHYLAQVYKCAPSEKIKTALQTSLNFLQYFVHPDGSFGGEYGSRRTEVYYPGGIALLAGEFPVALSIHNEMMNSIENLTTVTLVDIDMSNTAPLLSSSILALETASNKKKDTMLPYQVGESRTIFSEAGIAVYSNRCYYAVLGASNGGVLKVFEKESGRLAADDCGALAETGAGVMISTQSTRLDNPLSHQKNSFSFDSGFYAASQRQTTPLNYMALRLLNLTIMRISFLNELVKRLMVKWLIKTDKAFPLKRSRKIVFSTDRIEIEDTFTREGKLLLASLRQGGKFNTIHMASSRYFSGPRNFNVSEYLDHELLNNVGNLKISKSIYFESKNTKGDK